MTFSLEVLEHAPQSTPESNYNLCVNGHKTLTIRMRFAFLIECDAVDSLLRKASHDHLVDCHLLLRPSTLLLLDLDLDQRTFDHKRVFLGGNLKMKQVMRRGRQGQVPTTAHHKVMRRRLFRGTTSRDNMYLSDGRSLLRRTQRRRRQSCTDDDDTWQ